MAQPKLIVLYGGTTVALHLADSGVEASAKTRIVRLKRTPENVKFCRTLAAAPELYAAAHKVLAGLNARIDASPDTAKPVFDGIVDLHDAVGKVEAA